MRKYKRIDRWAALLMVFLITAAHPAAEGAAEDSSAVQVRMPAPERLARFANDPDFRYDRAPAGHTLSDRIREWLWHHVLQFLLLDEFAAIRRLLIYAFIAAVLGFVLWRMRNSQWGSAFFDRHATGETTAPATPMNIHQMDFSRLIEEAVAQKQYRQAIRWHFLQTLKLLTDGGQISWGPEKTNRQYLAEMGNEALAGAFRHLITVFEYIWYGHFALSRKGYEQFAARFAAFDQRIAPAASLSGGASAQGASGRSAAGNEIQSDEQGS